MKIIENPDKVFWSQGKGASQQDRNDHNERPFQPSRMARIKKTDNDRCQLGYGEIGTVLLLLGMSNGAAALFLEKRYRITT